MAADGAAPTGATMVDAQMSNVRVLKPYAGFEAKYQGQGALRPVAFPGSLDPQAGQTDISPDLIAGIKVPQGARILLQFPMCFASLDGENPAPFTEYTYRLVWRYRTLPSSTTIQKSRRVAPYHYPQQVIGAPEGASARIVIPACWHVIAYESTEPVPSGAGTLGIRVEDIIPKLDDINLFGLPILPNGNAAVIEQGILDPTVIEGASSPIYMPFWTDAEADELIIFAIRTAATALDTWDFTSASSDLSFSNIYGTGNGAHEPYPGVGILLQTGTTP